MCQAGWDGSKPNTGQVHRTPRAGVESQRYAGVALGFWIDWIQVRILTLLPTSQGALVN